MQCHSGPACAEADLRRQACAGISFSKLYIGIAEQVRDDTKTF